MAQTPRARRLNRWGLVLACLLGVLFGLGAYTFGVARGFSYMSNDPRACVNCHIMRSEYEGWQHASHHAVATCNDCHVPHHPIRKWVTKAENGFNHSWGFTFQDFHEPIQLKRRSWEVLQDNCLYCHRQFVSEITAHSRLADDEVNCIRCHADVGHGAPRDGEGLSVVRPEQRTAAEQGR